MQPAGWAGHLLIRPIEGCAKDAARSDVIVLLNHSIRYFKDPGSAVPYCTVMWYD
jgi:hypothetical protein